MKMSTGGIGAVATSQACNARSMFPYAWAWNAIGATHDDNSSIPDYEGNVTVVAPLIPPAGQFENDAKGIKITSTGPASLPVFYDEGTDATDKSSKLDASVIDFNSARYMHGVFDFSGWTTGTPFSTGIADGALLVYYTLSVLGGEIRPATSIIRNDVNENKTIIVWDMTTLGDLWEASTVRTDWKDISGNLPIGIAPYFVSGFSSGNSMIWHGMVLSDRILTDIPLPIRTHMG